MIQAGEDGAEDPQRGKGTGRMEMFQQDCTLNKDSAHFWAWSILKTGCLSLLPYLSVYLIF